MEERRWEGGKLFIFSLLGYFPSCLFSCLLFLICFIILNLPPSSPPSIPPPPTQAPSGGIVRSQIPEICKQLLPSNSTDLFLSRACPPALGCYSLGAAVYEINPALKEANGQDKVIRQWTRTDRSCGTSIPLISKGKDGSNAAYCVGAEAGSSQWALLGMDLTTGEDVLNHQVRLSFFFFSLTYVPPSFLPSFLPSLPPSLHSTYPLISMFSHNNQKQFYKEFGAKNIFVNPFYAGVEAIGDDQVVIGSVGGVVLVTPLQGNAAAAK